MAAFYIEIIEGTRAVRVRDEAIPPWTVVFYGLLFAAVTWNIFHAPLSAFLRPSGFAQWGWVLFIAFFGTVLAFICYTEGIKRIGATRASITATLEPITAGLIAWLLLGETMELWQIVGAALVIASVIGLQASKTTGKTAESPLDFLHGRPHLYIKTASTVILTEHRAKRPFNP